MGGNPSSRDYKTLSGLQQNQAVVKTKRHFEQPSRTSDMQQLAEKESPGSSEEI